MSTYSPLPDGRYMAAIVKVWRKDDLKSSSLNLGLRIVAGKHKGSTLVRRYYKSADRFIYTEFATMGIMLDTKHEKFFDEAVGASERLIGSLVEISLRTRAGVQYRWIEKYIGRMEIEKAES